MPTQSEKDTAKAKARQGGSQAERDTARAKSRQDGGDGGTAARMSSREANAGLTLRGNNTMAGRESGNSKTQTERDTGRAQSRITRSAEYQKRIDAAANQEQVGTPQGNISFTSSRTIAGGGGGGLEGIEIIFADQTEAFISTGTILEDYDGQDYWSVVFGVSDGAFTQAVSFDSTQELWDDVGDDQSVYRLRVTTLNNESDPTQISVYGQYRESILCVNGDPVTVLVKIS